MSFGFPLGLLALAAAGPLIAAYFLRRKQPPRIVSALFLWRSPDQQAQAGPRFQRFSRELSLLLELAAVLCAAAFLADLRWRASPSRKHVVIVVDGGFSMQARSPSGKSAADRARDKIAALVVSEGAGQLTLVESGLKPTVLAGPQAEVTHALSALERWVPSQPSHELAPALSLARELAGGKGHRVTFFTDGPLAEGTALAPEIEVVSVGEPLDNVALLSAQRSDAEGLAHLTVRVGNFGREGKQVPLQLGTRTERLELAPGASTVVQVTMPADGPLEVLLPEDALTVDGAVTLLPAPPQHTKVVMLPGLDPAVVKLLQRGLSVLPGVELGAAVEAGAMTFGPSDAVASVTLGAAGPLKSYLGPFFAQKGSPVLEDVQLSGAIWTAGANPPGLPLMTAGNAVLVTEEDDGRVHLNLDLSRSNVQRTVAWPVLISNLVRRARVLQPGFARHQLMLGEEIPVTTAPGARYVLQGPKGLERPVLGVGPVTLPAAAQPGEWTLLREGKPTDSLVVLPLDPRESDLRTRGPFEVKAAATEGVASLALQRPRSFWPLLPLLALLLVDFWLTARTGARA